MKNLILALILALSIITLTACTPATDGGDKKDDTSSAVSEESKAEESEVESKGESKAPDLTGEWKQVDSNSETSYQTATITGDTIEIYWVNTEEDSKALYWAGSFAAPVDDKDYTWDSKNDTEKTGSAILASSDESKTFTYSKGEISYEVSMMGVNTTVKLKNTDKSK